MMVVKGVEVLCSALGGLLLCWDDARTDYRLWLKRVWS